MARPTANNMYNQDYDHRTYKPSYPGCDQAHVKAVACPGCGYDQHPNFVRPDGLIICRACRRWAAISADTGLPVTVDEGSELPGWAIAATCDPLPPLDLTPRKGVCGFCYKRRLCVEHRNDGGGMLRICRPCAKTV